MARLIAAMLVLGMTGPAWAQKKPCEELKGEIEAKLKAKGVTKYELDIVAAADTKDAKVVGTCDGGAKKIVYKRG